MKKSNSICLVPKCGEASTSRGLCQKCYQVCSQLVSRGKTTWDKLEKEAKIHPPKKHPKMDWFLGK